MVLRRAFGRSLKDFGDLSKGEKFLVDCCREGVPANLGPQLPEEETDENRVRSNFVRFLALGGDESHPVHEYGVHLKGAWLVGELRLPSAAVPNRLVFDHCRMEALNLLHAQIKFLSLTGCRITNGILGDGLTCTAGVFIRGGTHISKEVRLLGASIAGNLDCSGSRLDGEDTGDALSLDGATIGCDLFLRHGFQAGGCVRLLGARIKGDVDCIGGVFHNPGKTAMSCDRVEVSGNMFLAAPFQANGEVRLLGASISGNLECSGGHFDNGNGHSLSADAASITRNVFLNQDFQAGGSVRLVGAKIGGDVYCNGGQFSNSGDAALQMSQCRIEGTFAFIAVARLEGAVDLSSAHAASLCDDSESWTGTDGSLILDGFTYERIVGMAPTDAKSRIRWLKRQRPDHLKAEFRPQPFEQLISVLRAIGHPNEARRVAIEKQTYLRKAGKVVPGGGWLHWLYGVTAGYGYRPVRLLVAIPVVWLVCAMIYAAAVDPHWLQGGQPLLAARSEEPSNACLLARAAARSGDPCPARAPDFRTFAPLAYSADVLLPIVDFGYQQEWRPVVATRDGTPLSWGLALRWVYWFEIAFGWVAGLLLAGVVGSLLKKD